MLLPPKSFPQKTLPYSFFRFYLPEHCDLSCHVKCTLAIESQQCLNPQVIFKADKEDFLSSIENIYLQENASKGRTCGQYTSKVVGTGRACTLLKPIALSLTPRDSTLGIADLLTLTKLNS